MIMVNKTHASSSHALHEVKKSVVYATNWHISDQSNTNYSQLMTEAFLNKPDWKH